MLELDRNTKVAITNMLKEHVNSGKRDGEFEHRNWIYKREQNGHLELEDTKSEIKN